MSKKIVKIGLSLENCEFIEVPRKYFGFLQIDNIKESIKRLGCNYVTDMLECKTFFISIRNDLPNLESTLFSKEKAIDRLKHYNDITSVVAYYEDGTERNIYVSWDEEDEQYNRYQDTYVNKSGDVYVSISKNKKLFDFISKEEIDTDSDFHWSMFEE